MSEMETTHAEINRFIKLLIKKRHLVIILSLSIMSVIIWGSYFIPKKYEAKSIIFIESNVIEQLVKGIAITPSMDARIKVLRDTMLGRSLVLNVLRKLDLDSQAKDDKELEEMIIKFQEKTSVQVKNGDLVTVSYINKDPVLARDYINNLVGEYVEKNVFAKREEAYDATKFLDRQVAFFKEKMDKGEDQVIKFRQEQGIFVALDERSIIEEIKKYKSDIESMNIRASELIASKKSIEEQMKGEKPFTVTMFNTRDVQGTISSLENRLKQLLVKYTENYPEVIKLKAEIELLKSEPANQAADSSNIHTESGISAMNPVYQEIKQRIIDIDAEIN
ncbi:MAG: chain length-determining protein, partial [Nitrospirota bacterium]|nr:chain length-determining protein [Nitrospirota bacterium]